MNDSTNGKLLLFSGLLYVASLACPAFLIGAPANTDFYGWMCLGLGAYANTGAVFPNWAGASWYANGFFFLVIICALALPRHLWLQRTFAAATLFLMLLFLGCEQYLLWSPRAHSKSIPVEVTPFVGYYLWLLSGLVLVVYSLWTRPNEGERAQLSSTGTAISS